MTKEELRQRMRTLKKQYGAEALERLSGPVMAQVAAHAWFKDARTVMVYHALKDEVHTQDFIERWHLEKEIWLPVVEGDDIRLKRYEGAARLRDGALRVQEPDTDEYQEDYGKIDLVIVPGMAFDAAGYRLGRGKGFYDRFLPKVKAPKMGVCFPFQFVDEVPHDVWDVPMDTVLHGMDTK